MFERLNVLFKPSQKELAPGEIECKKTFELTGIVEKIEKLRDDKILKYLENEPAHIEYNPNEIKIIFDYGKYEKRIGLIEKWKEISIIKNGSYIQFKYLDLREDSQNIEFISNKPTEILGKINEVMIKIDYERK